jgi:hypothetical protein
LAAEHSPEQIAPPMSTISPPLHHTQHPMILMYIYAWLMQIDGVVKWGKTFFSWEREQNSLVTNTHTNGGVCFGVG